jgi:hypothetical protein
MLAGVMWASWHFIPFVQTGNSASWVLWQSLKTVATRMVTVWIYNKTGKSVFATILYHAMDNVSWSSFPNSGSHYNPMVTGVVSLLAAIILMFKMVSKKTSS